MAAKSSDTIRDKTTSGFGVKNAFRFKVSI